MKKRSPQEKKILDYLNQSRNCYGENDKSSRKSVRLRKNFVNRNFRHKTQNLLNQSDIDPEELQESIDSQRREDWKKHSDQPLAQHLEMQSSLYGGQKSKRLKGSLRKAAIRRLRRKDRDTYL